MGALRKAGVWLGLVEEDDRDDGGYDDEFAEEDFTPIRPRTAGRAARLAERDRVHELDRVREAELAPDESTRHDAGRADPGRRDSGRHDTGRTESARLDAARTDRGSVRSLARPSSQATVSTVSSVSFPTQDNLALAPQTQLRERAVAPVEPAKRYQITTLHPNTFTEARAIGEQFRDGVPVIINLTEMAESDARRLVDFAAGLAFGLRGTIERVTNRVFLISPANIQVTAEDKAKIAEGGFFDQS